jgi:glycosyltransferase involved in cell wall biosynthesis
MKVLLVSHTCQSATEGQPKCWELSRLGGIELCVLVPDRWKRYGQWRRAEVPRENSFRFEIGRVRWPWLGKAQCYAHHYPGMAKLLADFRPDVIDLWEEPWSAVSFQACRLRDRYLPTAKIVSETEQNIDKRLPPPFEFFRKFTLSRADFVVGRNKEAIEIVRRKGFAGPAAVVPNAVDAELFCPLDRAACRRELGFEDFTVGYVGRLVEEKGVVDLVRGIAAGPGNVRGVFVGDGEAAAQIASMAAVLGISNRIRVMANRPGSELPKIFNAMDVLALPSRTTARWKEQFGRVIIEAHACATPVIGSSSGAIPEVMGEGGLIFPEGDTAALAAAIARLALDPALGARLGRVGCEQVRSRFTWRHVAERMRGVYQTVLRPESQEAADFQPLFESYYEQSYR